MAQLKTYRRVLTIAGSDSGGGAGIQADLKTIAANGCYGMSVITALTAQNTLGVSGIHAVPVDFVAAQMEAVLSDIGVDAVKIGMLFSPELIRTVAENLQKFNIRTIVLDPVMIAQSGDKLLQDEAIEALKEYLIPLAHLITPNLPEASVLLGREIRTVSAIETAAVELAALGCAKRADQGRPPGIGATATTASTSAQSNEWSSCRANGSPPATTTAPAALCPRPSLRSSPAAKPSRAPCASPRTTSPGPSVPEPNTASVMATGRCTTFSAIFDHCG